MSISIIMGNKIIGSKFPELMDQLIPIGPIINTLIEEYVRNLIQKDKESWEKIPGGMPEAMSSEKYEKHIRKNINSKRLQKISSWEEVVINDSLMRDILFLKNQDTEVS
jgi:hypothetical protein